MPFIGRLNNTDASIDDGTIQNKELVSAEINIGGVAISLGGTVTQPAFDLTNAFNYPSGNITGIVSASQVQGGPGSGLDADLLDSQEGTYYLDNTTLTLSTTNSNFKIPFANTTANVTGNYSLLQANTSTFTYNPSTDALSVGSVGVGTDNPTTPLHIVSPSTGFKVQRDNKTFTINANYASQNLCAFEFTDALGFFPGGSTEKVRITSDGNVGIGTDNPGSKLTVEDNSASGTTNVFIYNKGGDSSLYLLNDDRTSAAAGALVDNGSYIELSGKWNSAVTDSNRTFGRIGAFKENNTSTDQSGYLALYSRPNSGGLEERLRITSGGNVLLGGTLPGSPNISLNANGSTTFNGEANFSGAVVVNRPGNFTGLEIQNGGVQNAKITSNGVATFAGSIRGDGGTVTDSALVLTANNNSGKGLEIVNAGGTKNIEMGVDGSATFAGDVSIGAGLTISAPSGVGTAFIYGPDAIIIDPSPIGSPDGVVRIRGDLFVEGTETVINSETLDIADFVIGIASTATTNILADGSGLTFGPTSNSFLFENSTTSLKSSVNLNIALGNAYQIDGTNRLSASSLNLGTGTIIQSPTSNELTFETNSNERLRFTNDGGIYTKDTDQQLRFYRSAGDRFGGIRYDGSNFRVTLPAADNLIIEQSSGTTDLVKIDPTGLVGIGTNNFTSKLQVHGTLGLSASDDQESVFPGGRTKLTSGASGFIINHNDNSDTIFQNQGSERLRIASDGNVTIGGTFTSTVSTGTAPISVASSTLVTNLNAEFLSGLSSSYYLNYNNFSGTPTTIDNATNVTVNASSTNSNFKVTFANVTDGTNGNYGILMDTSVGFTYNPSNNRLSAGEITLSNAAEDKILLNGSISNWIQYSTAGVAAPAFTTRSAGTKLVLFPAISGTQVDYALGIEGSTLWYSVPTTSEVHNWYGGTTSMMSLSNSNLNVAGNITGSVLISDVANGTAPIQVSSATTVTNLSADLLDGQEGSYYLDYSNFSGTPTTIDNATNVTVTTSTTGSDFKIPFTNTTTSTTGNYALLQDSTGTFTYNPSTNTFTVGTISATSATAGGLTVNSTGLAITGSPGTIAGSNFGNGYLRIGTSSLGWAFDNNEMVTFGTCIIDSAGGSTLTFSNRPRFNGGTSGSSSPFTVDSTQVVTNLNADLLDGEEGSYYLDYANFSGTPTTIENATNVTLTVNTNNSNFKVPFANTVASTSGDYGLLQDNSATFTYNPSTNTLTVGTVSANTFTSTVASGTAPFTVTSSDLVTNLNADLLDGEEGSYYLNTSTSFGGNVSGTYNNITVNFNDLSNKTTATSNYTTTGTFTGNRLSSSTTTEAPLTVLSTIVVTNLNADLLDGEEGSYYLDYNNFENTPTDLFTEVADDTTPALGGTLETLGNLIQFGDSTSATDDRLQFGAAQDLQIYHDGNDSWVDENGPGNLYLNVSGANDSVISRVNNTNILSVNGIGATVNGTISATALTVTSTDLVDNLNADLLDGEEGTYYLNYNNFSNTPTIPTNNNQLTNGAGYITSFDITSQTDSKYLRSDEADTTVGDITISKTSPKLILNDTNEITGSYPSIQFDTDNGQGVLLEHNELNGELPVDGYGLILKGSPNNTQFPGTDTLTFTVLGDIYAGSATTSLTTRVLTTADEGASNGLDADLLDGEEGTYYLNYNNFSNTPTIPTNNNQLTNGAGYITSFDITSQTDSKYLRSDEEDEATKINIGGEISAGSDAKLQVYGFQRTGPIMIADGNTSDTTWSNTNEQWIYNDGGILKIGNDTTTGNKILTTADGGIAKARAAGWVPTYTDATESNVVWNYTENAVEIKNSADNNNGAAYKAVRMKSGDKVRIALQVKGSAANVNGLYIRIYFYNGDLPDGKTHVSNNATYSLVQEDSSGDTTWYENSAISASYVGFERTYTAPADGYMSVVILNWTGFTGSLYVLGPDIQFEQVNTSTNADNVALTISSSNSNFKIPFANTVISTTNDYGLLQDSEATFTYNPSTNTVTAGTFSGNATSANSAGTATNANNINCAATTDSTTFPVLVGSSAGGNSAPLVDSDLGYDASSTDPLLKVGIAAPGGIRIGSSTNDSYDSTGNSVISTLDATRHRQGRFPASGGITNSVGTAGIKFSDGDIQRQIDGDVQTAGSFAIFGRSSTTAKSDNFIWGSPSNGMRIGYSVVGLQTAGFIVSKTAVDGTSNPVDILTIAGDTDNLSFTGGNATFSNDVEAANFNSTSDIKLKENIEVIKDSTSILKEVKGVKFDWKEKKTSSIGVIAQDVEKVLPQLISEGDDEIKRVNYNGLVGVLIEAVKELTARVEELESKQK